MTHDLRQLRSLMGDVEHLTYEKVANFFNQSPQLRFIGAQVEWVRQGEALITIPEVRDVHQGGLGSNAINGGIIALLCDMALGLLGVDYWHEGFAGTQNLSIDYLKPLEATAISVHSKIEQVVGKKVIGLMEVLNEKNEICSYAHGILATGLKEKQN